MSDLFLERKFNPSIDLGIINELWLETQGCFNRHRVEWQGSYLSVDGSKMICWFQAPDMESARIAMRQANADIRVLWSGTVHDKPGLAAADLASANVVVERSFTESTPLETIQAIEDAGIHCLEMRNVRFIRTLHSLDRQRMVCLYAAPDAESVRQAQREAGVPFSDAWACVRVSTDTLPG